MLKITSPSHSRGPAASAQRLLASTWMSGRAGCGRRRRNLPSQERFEIECCFREDGAEVVILGRGNIVGKPLAAMLCQKAKGANATVTICHSGTRDIPAHCRRADILIAAMGVAEFVKADMIKPGATVIDVGVNRVNGKLVGDVDFANVQPVAGKITPNPGGVGPMTIAMLMQNTVRAAESTLN